MTIEQRFRAWVDKNSGMGLGNLDYALEDVESTASMMLEAFRAGWKAKPKQLNGEAKP